MVVVKGGDDGCGGSGRRGNESRGGDGKEDVGDGAIQLGLTLWVPDRESYRSQMAKFFTFRGFFSWICSGRQPNILA